MSDAQRMFALAAFLAAGGLWLLLPRGTSRGKLVGAVLMGVAVALWAAKVPRFQSWTADTVFIILAGLTVASAAATISLANPLYSAIWFGMSLLGAAGLFLYQGAQFLCVATIVVYAGAILVTFLFVLMLAQPQGRAYYDRVSWEALISAATGAVMVGVMSMAVYNALSTPAGGPPLAGATPAELEQGVLAPDHVVQLGTTLFARHLLAVEVAGVLLSAALIGAAAIVVQGRRTGPAAKEPKTSSPKR